MYTLQVENYTEGQGWQETCTTTAVKRCFLSAIAYSDELCRTDMDTGLDINKDTSTSVIFKM